MPSGCGSNPPVAEGLHIRRRRISIIHGDAEVESVGETRHHWQLRAGTEEDRKTTSVDGDAGLGFFPNGNATHRHLVKPEHQRYCVRRTQRLASLIGQLALEGDDVGVLGEGMATKEHKEHKEEAAGGSRGGAVGGAMADGWHKGVRFQISNCRFQSQAGVLGTLDLREIWIMMSSMFSISKSVTGTNSRSQLLQKGV